MPDHQDDPRWHAADSDRYESEGEGERYEFGQECLDRIALSLGGNTVVPLASTLLPVLLQVLILLGLTPLSLLILKLHPIQMCRCRALSSARLREPGRLRFHAVFLARPEVLFNIPRA